MGAETEASVWCDGPGDLGCPYMNAEQGPTIRAVREFLEGLGWVKRTRNGYTIDLCPICKES